MVARTEKTLVVPLVAMGSVPQYAVQLIIDDRREQLQKQAIKSLFVYPFAGREMSVAEVVGGRAAGAGEMVSPWELYYADDAGGDDANLVEYMQMHSPVIPGCESLYVKQLVAIIKERGYGRVVLLDSVDKGLWHADAPAAATPPGAESEAPRDVSVLQWGNRTLGGMKLEGDEALVNEAAGLAGWPGPLVRLVGEQVDAAGEDVAVEAVAVPVYDGWNGPAARALVQAAGVGGKTRPAAVAEGPVEGPAADRDGLARLEGVYN